MKKLLSILILLFISQMLAAQNNPKLVVGIVVDQMRYDYLYRYYDRYSERGFKRILKQGYNFKNAHFNYFPTYTGPGHAAVYTGTTPSVNGIVSNDWFDRKADKFIYCAGDSTAEAVGGSGEKGNISARNVQVTTITDELRLFYNHRSKVVGLSIKDRGAAIPAGHNPTGAYWYDSKSGDFISSTYYMDSLPEWVERFNDSEISDKYASQTWELLGDIEEYKNSTKDDSPYEYSLEGEKPTFPYDLSKVEKPLSTLSSTPFGNQLVLDFALEAIEGEGLGQDEITDFLAVSFSSTDYAGHAFGPRAVELEDMYLRLDLDIAQLLEYLDENIGENQYIVFLTADHGVVDVPDYLQDNNYPGKRVDYRTATGTLIYLLEQDLGKGDWITNFSNQQVYLSRELLKENDYEPDDVQELVKSILLEMDFVSDAYTATELSTRSMTDPMAVRWQNGFYAPLSGDVMVQMKSGYLFGKEGQPGTTHGSTFIYDTHIPILFYGAGIPAGESVRPVSVTDIAPSISMLLNISLPSGCTGQPLKELFE